MLIEGMVTKKQIAKGSKSERDAIVIITKIGEFVLKRATGNPFSDPELESLVGKQIECDGSIHNQYFMMTNWSEIK